MLLEDVNLLLLEYASGNFSRRGKVSEKKDEIDAVVSGINMLGEELEYSTISKNYFISIFNAVNDFILVAEPSGRIKNMNLSVKKFLGITDFDENHFSVRDFFKSNDNIFQQVKKHLKKKNHFAFESAFYSLYSGEIPVYCSCSKMTNKSGDADHYVIVAKDITRQKEAENLILKAIVETQESEQKRMSEDLHDSIGQQLSAARLFIHSMREQVNQSKEISPEAFQTCSEILDAAISNIRSICFNLMPGSLEQCGLAESIEQLVFLLNKQDRTRIIYTHDDSPVFLGKAAGISLYRIVQEFINNSFKHSKASLIEIKLTASEYVQVEMYDNGIGFDTGSGSVYRGNGLNNMNSRVKAFKGTFKLTSAPGKGTKLLVKFPNHGG